MESSRNDNIFVSIVIPAYNEENRIYATLAKVTEHFKNADFSYEIVIVNDGSRDNTLKIVENFLSNAQPQIDHQLLSFDKNRGKGFAIKKGMLAAKGEYVHFIDADCSAPIAEFGKFLKSFDDNYDVYIGSRKTIKNNNNKVKAPFYRKFFGYGYAYISSFLLDLNLSDTTCGFKCFKRHTVIPIFTRQLLNGWSFDSEILFLARKLGFNIKEIPINWTHNTQDSKVNVLIEIFKSGWELIKIKLNNLRGLYS